MPGTTYLITRRCFQRSFFLRPDEKTNQIFEFCLAYAAHLSGVQLHAYCAMSNHYHLVLTDVEGRLPKFMHWMNVYIAKMLNARWGRVESFWAPGSYNAVRLESDEVIAEKMLYVLMNPVAAGLVERCEEWPGARSSALELGGLPKSVRRPDSFFRSNGGIPPRVGLTVQLPPGMGVDLVERLAREVAAAERDCQTRRNGRSVVGVAGVLAQSPMSTPTHEEKPGGLVPTFSAVGRLMHERMMRHRREFVRAYREALSLFQQGMRDAVFPAGTYGLRLRLNVACASP